PMDSIRGYDRYLAYVERLIRDINKHLPKNRKTLAQLLVEKDAWVETNNGNKIYFKKGDLESVSKIVPESFHLRIKLPIVVIRMMKLGQGVFIVAGGRFEKHLVKTVLGLTKEPFNMAKEEEFYLYKPQVQELIGKLGSLIVIGFEAPQED
ncbi:MAG: DUF61 family protein, partial [Candidatus Bathyarchaeota archaeon]|nr:DUF61 family protein [Candidatus Bathyarchaeota archaeon]